MNHDGDIMKNSNEEKSEIKQGKEIHFYSWLHTSDADQDYWYELPFNPKMIKRFPPGEK